MDENLFLYDARLTLESFGGVCNLIFTNHIGDRACLASFPFCAGATIPD